MWLLHKQGIMSKKTKIVIRTRALDILECMLQLITRNKWTLSSMVDQLFSDTSFFLPWALRVSRLWKIPYILFMHFKILWYFMLTVSNRSIDVSPSLECWNNLLSESKFIIQQAKRQFHSVSLVSICFNIFIKTSGTYLISR